MHLYVLKNIDAEFVHVYRSGIRMVLKKTYCEDLREPETIYHLTGLNYTAELESGNYSSDINIYKLLVLTWH